MTDSNQSVDKKLTDLKGWLLVYTIGPAGFGIFAALAEVAELWRYGGDNTEWLIGIALLLVYATGLYLLIAIRKPLTRIYHIALAGFMAVALAIIAISTRDPVAAVACAGMSVWTGYWTRSKRVLQTYCVSTGQNG